MDWTRALEINRTALARIVAELVALLAAQGAVSRLPLPVYTTLARIMLPVESALRRLIVIAAHGLVVPPSRPMPQGIVFSAKRREGQRPAAFQLFDTRKRFSLEEQPKPRVVPRMRIIGGLSPREQFLAKFEHHPVNHNASSEAETLRLTRRLETVKRALDNLPHQANRMARWMARRQAMDKPVFTSPLRPGPPPGRNKRSRDEIQNILHECQSLARWALSANTS